MKRPTIHQRRLRFEDEEKWERLPTATRDRCRLLLSQLLEEVFKAEPEESRDE